MTDNSYQYSGITPIDNATPYTFNLVTGSTHAYTSPALQASDGSGGALGTTTAVTVSIGENGGGVSHGGPTGYFAWQLFDAYQYQNAAHPAPTFSINNLVAGHSYDLYLYGMEANYDTYGASFTVANVGGGTQTTTGALLDHFAAGANYVKYSGVVADLNGQITGSYTWSEHSNDMGFNGFTLVGPLASPEPCSLVLLATGLLGLLAYAWRKRR